MSIAFEAIWVHNDWYDTVVVCWAPDCLTAQLIYPDQTVCLTGVSNWWATRFAAGLTWDGQPAVIPTGQIGLIYSYDALIYPKWIFGPPPPEVGPDEVEAYLRKCGGAPATNISHKIVPGLKEVLEGAKAVPMPSESADMAPLPPRIKDI